MQPASGPRSCSSRGAGTGPDSPWWTRRRAWPSRSQALLARSAPAAGKLLSRGVFACPIASLQWVHAATCYTPVRTQETSNTAHARECANPKIQTQATPSKRVPFRPARQECTKQRARRSLCRSTSMSPQSERGSLGWQVSCSPCQPSVLLTVLRPGQKERRLQLLKSRLASSEIRGSSDRDDLARFGFRRLLGGQHRMGNLGAGNGALTRAVRQELLNPAAHNFWVSLRFNEKGNAEFHWSLLRVATSLRNHFLRSEIL